MDNVPIQTMIHRIRQAYIYNLHLGLAGWFDVFDGALLQKKFADCKALLDELYQGGYQLNEREQSYVTSRKAALLFCQGISCHLSGKYDEARTFYETSLRLHHDLNDANGEGQVIFAIDELQGPRNEEEIERQPLEQLANTPWVLGNSSTLLVERLKSLPTTEQVQVIVAAAIQNYPAPLLAAIAADTKEVQAAAASAIARVRPGPDYPSLFTMLTSSNWIVRWQAILILQRRSREDEKDFATHKAAVRQALTNLLEHGESDPVVRRDIALLLQSIGTAEDTPYLIALIDDEDPDVRASVVEALGTIKDKKTINALSHVRDGLDFRGKRVSQLASTAIESIAGKAAFQTASDAEIAQSSKSWWWVGLLMILPLIAPILTYTQSPITTAAFFKLIESLMSGTTFHWLLVGGLFVGWFQTNTVKSLKQMRRLWVHEEVTTVTLGALCTVEVILLNRAGLSHISIAGILLIAVAIGTAIGIPGGLTHNVLYSTCTKMAAILVQGVIFSIAVFAFLWTHNHFGGFIGSILGIIAYILTFLLLSIISTVLYFLLGFLLWIIAVFGPTGTVILCLLINLAFALLYDIKIGVFVGLTWMLAIIVAEIVERRAVTRQAPQLSRGQGIILALSYGVLLWVFFFGGWRALSL